MTSDQTDVLVIGAGGAGIFAAANASKMGAKVIVISKEPSGYGDTRISLGAMCRSAEGFFDSSEKFSRDMIKGGEFLNDPKLVGDLVDEATDAVIALEDCGHVFERNSSGVLKSPLGKFGGHSHNRTVMSPAFGVSMGHAIRGGLARSGVTVWEETVCAELILNEGEVAGAVVLCMKTGRVKSIQAKSVIIATGGAGSLYYPHTDCMPYVTGDGYSLALAAGAELVDMEQVQFIPFALTHPQSMMGVIVGDGSMAQPFGKLLNGRGEVILKNFHNMTRAKLAMIMIKEINNGGATEHGGLLFDVSTNMKIPILKTVYKNMMRRKAAHFLRNVRRAYGRDAAEFKEPWDVLPSAHYFMGGVKTDEFCKSRVKGLYACGQAQGGVMGGNRLGSTSLTEIFVFGKRAGTAAAEDAKSRGYPDGGAAKNAVKRVEGLFGRKGKTKPVHLKKRLRELMWKYTGPLRDGEGLATALDGLAEIKRDSSELAISSFRRYNTEVVDAIELSHMIIAAEAIIISALERKETRGAHVRSDYPDTEDTTTPKNVVVRQTEGRLIATSQEALP